MKAVKERIRVGAVFFCVLSFWATAEEPPFRVRGIEGRVAVYDATNAAREAVAWVPAETVFEGRGELKDDASWVCVRPPESVSVWVYRELVRGGVVAADNVRVRSGAGLAFHPVGSLNRGDRVEVRGAYGDWLRIRPPSGLLFWVLRDQVEPLAMAPLAPPAVGPEGEGAAETSTNVEPATADASVATNRAVEVARPPAALAGYALTEAAGQGERVRLTGVLDWGAVGAVDAPFCLIEQTNDEARLVCHLMAGREEAAPLVGASVVVDGRRWFVKGADAPVVVAERLQAAESREE